MDALLAPRPAEVDRPRVEAELGALDAVRPVLPDPDAVVGVAVGVVTPPPPEGAGQEHVAVITITLDPGRFSVMVVVVAS